LADPAFSSARVPEYRDFAKLNSLLSEICILQMACKIICSSFAPELGNKAFLSAYAVWLMRLLSEMHIIRKNNNGNYHVPWF
jgi:hypothetical protein